MELDFRDLRLRWPAELVLGVLDSSVRSAVDSVALTYLIEESCVNSAGLSLSNSSNFPPAELTSLSTINRFDPVEVSSAQEQDFQTFLRDFRDALLGGKIAPYSKPRYYRARVRGTSDSVDVLHGNALLGELLNEIGELDHCGYFDDAFGDSCCDARIDRTKVAPDVITERLGVATSWTWPPGPYDYDAALAKVPLARKDDLVLEHTFDLLEVCHDLVSRPRHRSWHEFCDEWDYHDFDRPAGQKVYRWRINAVLDRSNLDLRLAGTGADTGRLVRTPGDPRSTLGERAVVSAPHEHVDRIAHAVSKFRARDATREDKRDAIKALGDVLEHRRSEVKQSLGSKDEAALFTILNEFDIRHHRNGQKTEYDEDFLDWIFWTFLASVAFMNSRLAGLEGSRQH